MVLRLAAVVVLSAGLAVAAEPGDGWRHLAAPDAAPAGWRDPGFDDSRWLAGSSGLDVAPGATVLLRRSFEVADPALVTAVSVAVASAGPLAMYLNGVEVLRSPRPLPARVDPGSGQRRGFDVDLSGIRHELRAGRNTVALAVHGLVVGPELRLAAADAPPSSDPPGPQAAAFVVGRVGAEVDGPRFVIIMIGDGMGPLQLEAANLYAGSVPEYQIDPAWSRLWMTTYPDGGGYDSAAAWSSFSYPIYGATDSAAAATAMFTGCKTANIRIDADTAGTARLQNLGELARARGMLVGAVSTVPVSHATPGAFTSHNLSRANTYAIADEALFGDPNSTGSTAVDARYGGGFGPTLPTVDVLVGDRASGYVHTLQRAKLVADAGQPGAHCLVEGETGVDGAAALLAAADAPDCGKLVGLFDRADLRVTLAGGGYTLETPSLAASTAATLAVLERSAGGFALMVEGGAVDWGGHANDLDWTLGELLDFNQAVATVSQWVDDPASAATWDNTLLVVTADHETGYLTSAPGVFADQPFVPGSITDATLALEKVNLASGRRASWVDDAPANDRIDAGETVYWAWNAAGHTNSLVPVFARGLGADLLLQLATAVDPVRGPYADNTDLFHVAAAVLSGDAVFSDGFESGDLVRWSASVNGG